MAVRRVAVVDLRTAASRHLGGAKGQPSRGRERSAPLPQLPAGRYVRRGPAGVVTARDLARITTANVPGLIGFDGLTASNSAAVNPAIGDVSPPDQGLAVGPGAHGPVIVEFVNSALAIYSEDGRTLLGAVPAYRTFGVAPSVFLTDPRAYWDPQTGHWFLTILSVGDGVSAPLSKQYIAVSQTRDPFGRYTVFFIGTSDTSNVAGKCPCFGDFDMIGANANGFYITVDEYPVNPAAQTTYDGALIFAISKAGLIRAAEGGPAPQGQGYRVPLSDQFGSMQLSPASAPQGASSPGTEYFVESDTRLPHNGSFGSGLEVFALLHTRVLASGGRPELVSRAISTESYSQPPDAAQQPGPIPLGAELGRREGQLKTNDNGVQQVTYTHGMLYAELSTGFQGSNRSRSGVAWFILRARAMARSISVRSVREGYVKTRQFLLYPTIGVNARGDGYMTMTLSGDAYYPSPAYIAFDATKGAAGLVRVANQGARPLDDFTCYPPFTNGHCRFGDYSMAQAFDGRIYMATEYVPAVPRDINSNWGTGIWSVAAP